MLKKLRQTTRQPNASLGLLILRIGSAISMIALHEHPKVATWNETVEKFADPFGMGTTVSVALVVFAEYLCALLVALGWFTRLATIPLIIAMTTATFIVNADLTFLQQEKGYMYLVIYLALLCTGAGKYSIDGAGSRG